MTSPKPKLGRPVTRALTPDMATPKEQLAAAEQGCAVAQACAVKVVVAVVAKIPRFLDLDKAAQAAQVNSCVAAASHDLQVGG